MITPFSGSGRIDCKAVKRLIEARAYPVSAIYFHNKYGVRMNTIIRSKNTSMLHENAIHDIDALFNSEQIWRIRLGL